jgi:hypothetical protein
MYIPTLVAPYFVTRCHSGNLDLRCATAMKYFEQRNIADGHE